MDKIIKIKCFWSIKTKNLDLSGIDTDCYLNLFLFSNDRNI